MITQNLRVFRELCSALSAANQIGFWGQSQGGWIAPLAASRFPEAAFAVALSVALSGGGLSPADTELFDTEFELIKAGYTAEEVKDALAFQKLKNEIIGLADKWDEYSKARAIAKDKKWFRHHGIDVFGPEKPDHPFWTYMRSFYLYDPAPTLRASKAPQRKSQPDGGSPRESQRVCPPQTIPTGFLRNDGRVDHDSASSACTGKALDH